jgi:hypothetical protein
MGGIRTVEIEPTQVFRWLVRAGLIVVGVGCSRAGTIGEAAVLSRQLQAEFHRPAAVMLDGRRRLIVTIQADSAADSTDATGPAAQAYQVATFVGTHYQHAGALKAVTVIVEPSLSDSAGQPSTSTFTASEFNPTAARAVAPGTKSD